MYEKSFAARARRIGWLRHRVAFFWCCLWLGAGVQGGIVDPTFNCVLGADNGEVHAVVVDPNGRTLIGGKFASVAGVRRLCVARLLPDGSLDPSFNGGAVVGEVYALALQPDGKVILGGSLTSINGIRRLGIARLNSDGTLDAGFDPGSGAAISATVGGSVLAVCLQSDSGIVIGGNFTTFNGVPRARIARLLPNGALDTSFDPGSGLTGGNQRVAALGIEPGGKIYAGGSFSMANGSPRRNLVRFDTSGSVDPVFSTGEACDQVFSLIVEADGKVVVGGYRFFRRFTWTGLMDYRFSEPDFVRSQNAEVKAIAAALNGYVIGGDFSRVRTASNLYGVVYGKDGFVAVGLNGTVLTSPDGTTWAPTSSSTAETLRGVAFGKDMFVAVGSGGSVMTSADSLTWIPHDLIGDESLHAVCFARDLFVSVGDNGAILTSDDGWAWQPRNSNTLETLKGVTCNTGTDPLWVVVGTHGTILTSPDTIKWTPRPSGTTNDLNAVSFAENLYVAVGGTGTLLVSTDATTWEPRKSGVTVPLRGVGSAQGKFTVAGVEGTLVYPLIGTNWARAWTPSYISLNAVASKDALRVVVGDAGVILTATDPTTWTQQNNQAADCQYMVALGLNGLRQASFDSTLDKGPGILLTTTAPSVQSLAVAQNGSLCIGGSFLRADNVASADVVQLMSDGKRDPSFNIGTGVGGATAPSAILVQPDDKILVGGDFTSVNGVAMNRIARLNPDGSLDPEFSPGRGADRTVACLALQENGQILLAGDFNSIDRLSRRPVARINTNGTADASFDPKSGPAFNSFITAMAVQRDGKVLINGSSKRIMRLNSDGSQDTAFNVGQGALGGYVNAILVLDDNDIVVGGSFTNISSSSANRLARLHDSGFTHSVFQEAIGSAANASVDVLALQWDEHRKQTYIVAGGGFTTFNGTQRGKLLRLDLDGQLDTDWNYGTGPDKNVTGLAWYFESPATYTYVGGDFTTFSGYARSRVARIIGLVALDPGFNTGPGPDGRVTAMAMHGHGRLLIGGQFTTIDNEPWPNLVRLTKGDSAPPPYDQWKAGFFTSGELTDPAVSGDDVDPDGDGISNLFEYAYGLNPKEKSRLGLPSGQVASGGPDGKDYFVLLLHRRVGASGLQYAIEVSDDLWTWQPAGARVEVIESIPDIGNSTETVRVRLTPAIQDLHRSYVRVVVTKS